MPHHCTSPSVSLRDWCARWSTCSARSCVPPQRRSAHGRFARARLSCHTQWNKSHTIRRTSASSVTIYLRRRPSSRRSAYMPCSRASLVEETLTRSIAVSFSSLIIRFWRPCHHCHLTLTSIKRQELIFCRCSQSPQATLSGFAQKSPCIYCSQHHQNSTSYKDWRHLHAIALILFHGFRLRLPIMIALMADWFPCSPPPLEGPLSWCSSPF